MKLYSIREWGKLYENSRSRVVTDLAWVKVPNHHDGENYTSIVTHEKGAIIFSAWILIVQIASKCDPRGTLIRDNQKPHTPLTLSLKTRAPVEWFEIALDYLEHHTDWIEVQEVSGDRQPTVIVPSPAYHPPVIDLPKKGMNGMKEGNGIPATLDEAVSMTMTCGIPPDFVELVFTKWFERDGRDGAGVEVGFVKHAVGRWSREGMNWRNGTHNGKENKAKTRFKPQGMPNPGNGNF